MKHFNTINEGAEILGKANTQQWVEILIEKLKVAFCEEMQAWYGYIITNKFLTGGERKEIADTYEDNAKDEYEDHAMWILERLNQLDATIDDISSPEDWKTLTVKHPYIRPVFPIIDEKEDKTKIYSYNNLSQQINAEMNAIETYQDLIEFTEGKDPVTHRKCKEILEDEQSHYQSLLEFQDDMQTTMTMQKKQY